MKTFLWTTFFWIVVAIAGLLCLGFGNLGTQVLDNAWIAKFLPKNIQVATCDSVVASEMENIDWCAQAEANNCYPVVEEEVVVEEENPLGETAWLEQPLSDIISNQKVIYDYMQSSFAATQQMVNDLSNKVNQISQNSNIVENPVIDEKEAQRLQLQAQIEALQNEMNNL